MISMLRKSMELKLAGSLFCIIGLAFFILIFSFKRVQVSQTHEIKDQVAGLLSLVKTDGLDQKTAQQMVEVKTGLEKIGERTQGLSAVIITGIVCFLFVIVAMGGVFRLFFLKPLKILTKSLESAIEGEERDLTFRLNYNRTDEIGILGNCFDTFISNLDEVIMNIGKKTETVSAISSEVFSTSETMDEESSDLFTRSNSVAAAAEEMNASMHTVAAASEEASTNIAMVADAAGQMQINITGVAHNCIEAKKISSNAILKVDTATRQVGLLGEAAKEISKVTQVITDIAEQTNLLALNATIEAARAGAAGKGFAVVASEIKSLAAQTADATLSIREKIEGIQKSTQDTVYEVGTISQVISDVDDIVNEIAKAIEDQSATASEVATNIEQASIGISEVNENVAQSSQVASEIASDIARVDGVAADMSHRATHMTASAKDLETLSSQLRQMIRIFRVSKTDADSFSDNGLTEKEIPDLMPWSPKLELSIEVIDGHHKKLVAFINLLHKAMRLQKGTKEVGGILKNLAEYTVFHFAFEEELFKKYGYPEYENHRKIHKKLVAQVLDYQKDFTTGKATITMDLMDFLTDWLKDHILKTDKAYVPFLKGRMKDQ